MAMCQEVNSGTCELSTGGFSCSRRANNEVHTTSEPCRLWMARRGSSSYGDRP